MKRTRRTILSAFMFTTLTLAFHTATADQMPDNVAIVNGEAIPAPEFFERLQRLTAREFIVSGNPVTFTNLNSGQLLMNLMINERLTFQWAIKTKQMPTDAEVDAEVDRIKQQPQIQAAISSRQLSEAFLKQNIRFQKARFNLATTAVSVTPDEIEKYYKSHIAAYTTPDRFTIQGLSTTKQADLAKIQADIKAGKTWEDLVKVYSEDPTVVARKGEMGTFAATDQGLPAPIREALQTLKEGQTSPPVKVEADAGAGKPKVTLWWFLRMTHREPAQSLPFAVVKPQVEQALMLERAGGLQVADKKITDFRQLSDIKINLPGYDALLPKPKKP